MCFFYFLLLEKQFSPGIHQNPEELHNVPTFSTVGHRPEILILEITNEIQERIDFCSIQLKTKLKQISLLIF